MVQFSKIDVFITVRMKEPPKKFQPFTKDHVNDRDLVIKMLKHETGIATGEWGQQRYRDPGSGTSVSLDNEYAFNRRTLHDFGFNTSDEDVLTFRTIFKNYFKGPDDYDKEVIDSSYYMKNNRCVYYQAEPLANGDLLPNCRLYKLDGTTATDLHSAIRGSSGASRGLICAYSNS